MKEDLLHFIWKFGRFNHKDLVTTENQPIEIINVGKHNFSDGPDFSEAKIKIGDTVWAGHVEIHVNTSDWLKHGHTGNKKYGNVILHVVYDHDLEDSEDQIPTLVLNGLIPPILFKRFEKLMNNQKTILCSEYFSEMDALVFNHWKERLLIERLERKVGEIREDLKENDGDWEASFLKWLLKYSGGAANKEIFDLLSRSIDYKILLKHSDDSFRLESLLLGQAGFLDEPFKESYPNQLREEYLYLKSKYQLRPMPKFLWNLKGIRPACFPTVRLAQIAQLISGKNPLMANILQAKNIKEIFLGLTPSEYWFNHYLPGRMSVNRNKKTGDDFTKTMLINVISPFLFAYGQSLGNEKMTDKAFLILESLPAEMNVKTKAWENAGWKMEHANDSQAAIQLLDNYCSKKRCLHCAIGNRVLKIENANFGVTSLYEDINAAG